MNGSVTRRELLAHASAGVVATVGLAVVEPTAARRSISGDGSDRWSSYRGGSANLGSVSTPGPDLEDRWWQIQDDRGVTVPAVADNRIYLGVGTRVAAIDPDTGFESWVYDVGSEPVLSPAIDDETGTIVVTTDDGSIVGLSDAGDERWSIGVDGVPGAPVIEDGSVYVGSSQGVLVSLDVESGDVQWRESVRSGSELDTNPEYRVSPAVSEGTVFANLSTGYTSGSEVIAVDATDGSVEWRFTAGEDDLSAPAVDDEMVYVTGDPSLIAVSKHSGSERWRTDLGRYGSQTPPAVTGDVVTTLSHYAELYACDRRSGEQLWTFSLDTSQNADAATHAGDRVYVFDRDANTVRALDLETGLERESITFEDEPDWSNDTGPVVTADALYCPYGTALRAVGAARDDEPTAADADANGSGDRADDGGSQTLEAEESDSTSSGDGQRATESSESDETSVFDRIPLSTIEAIAGIVASIASILGVRRQRSNRS